MDEILQVIGRIGGDDPPTRQELDTARTALRDALRSARDEAAPDLEVLTTLRAAWDAAGQALEALEAEEAEAREAADQILDGLDLDDGEKDDVDVDAADEEEEKEEEEVEAVAAGGRHRVLPLDEAVARLRPRLQLREPAAPAGPVEQVVRRVLLGPDLQSPPDSGLSMSAVIDQIERATRSTRPGRTQVLQVRSERPDHRRLVHEAGDNTALLDAVTRPNAVAAAGGLCGLPETFDGGMVPWSSARPVRDSLPDFTSGTGEVQFFPAQCLPASGTAVWTTTDDAAVDEAASGTWKDCDFIDCAEVSTSQVHAVYRCLEIGNFQHRFHRMRWDEAIARVIAQQARIAEQQLLTLMIAGAATAHTVADTGSIYYTLVNAYGRAASQIRSLQRLPDGVPLRTWLPSWIGSAVQNDLVARRLAFTHETGAGRAAVVAALANEGVNVTWSPDVEVFGPQASGAPDDYPATFETPLAPEGYYTFLDGGSFDLGTEIRDHDLNRQNKLALFAETFEGVISRGCEAKALTIPVTVCDTPQGCA